MFSVHLYPELRFLDASDSRMTPEILEGSNMLVYLSLARCDITELHNLSFPNLRTLDLSDNYIKSYCTMVNALDLILLLLTGIGQIYIYATTRAEDMLFVGRTPRSEDMDLARRTTGLTGVMHVYFLSRPESQFAWPAVPQQLPGGKWNCSVPHWPRFRPHLTCNLEPECASETHFQCPGPDLYCLPVFVRCNGVHDCPGREDEAACDSYTCPGFYRCRASSVCLHPDHVCDNVYHCPQKDDELLCVNLYPNVRYLDASDSGLGVKQLTTNRLMIFLSLSRCNLTHLDSLVLPNLRHLDLSDNHLTVLKREDLLGLGNLQLDVKKLIPFPHLQTLNLSECEVDRILEDGFQSLPKLRVLDLRGCPVSDFPRGVFDHLGGGKSGFGVFVTHLCLSDFLMGVYLALIGLADRMREK
nr:hypothetical protein BaRGS_026964 [Batillaria attramentaria]